MLANRRAARLEEIAEHGWPVSENTTEDTGISQIVLLPARAVDGEVRYYRPRNHFQAGTM